MQKQTVQQFHPAARTWIIAGSVLGVGLLLLVLAIVGASTASGPPRAAREYRQSELAVKVQRLLDRKAYAAAEGIFNAKLMEHADDAALHVQYTRWLILSRNLHSPGFMQTPLYPNEPLTEFYATGIAKEAAKRATQLDPEVRTYFAWTVLSALRDRIDAELEAGSGVISKANVWDVINLQINNGFQKTMLLLAWDALEASPETAALFVKDFRALTEKAIAKGKVATASMLGNLLGDLEQGGEDGERDFELACDALHRSLANYKADEENWLKETLKIFQAIWAHDELKHARNGQGPESFTRLEQELQKRGYTLMKVN